MNEEDASGHKVTFCICLCLWAKIDFSAKEEVMLVLFFTYPLHTPTNCHSAFCWNRWIPSFKHCPQLSVWEGLGICKNEAKLRGGVIWYQ